MSYWARPKWSQKFLWRINLLAPVTLPTYNLINNILEETRNASKESMQQAALEEVQEMGRDQNTDTTVSGDRTWMKRGHTSLHSVCTVIGANTGKAIDTMVLLYFCHDCSSWRGPKRVVVMVSGMKNMRKLEIAK